MSESEPHIERLDGFDVVRIELEPDEQGETTVRWLLARCPFCDGPDHGEPCPEVGFWSDSPQG